MTTFPLERSRRHSGYTSGQQPDGAIGSPLGTPEESGARLHQPASAEQDTQSFHRPYLPPRAFMGYACGPDGIAVRVCSWCQGAAEVTKWAAPLPVTHGICPECAQAAFAELLGENPATQELCLTR